MDKVSQVIRQEHHNQAVSSMPPSLCSLSLFLINRGIGLQFGLVPGQQGRLPWLSAAFSSLWKEEKKGKNLSDAHSLGGDSYWKKKGSRQFSTWTRCRGWLWKSYTAPKHILWLCFYLYYLYFVFAWLEIVTGWKSSEKTETPHI